MSKSLLSLWLLMWIIFISKDVQWIQRYLSVHHFWWRFIELRQWLVIILLELLLVVVLDWLSLCGNVFLLFLVKLLLKFTLYRLLCDDGWDLASLRHLLIDGRDKLWVLLLALTVILSVFVWVARDITDRSDRLDIFNSLEVFADSVASFLVRGNVSLWS